MDDIKIIKDFISQEECEILIGHIENNLESFHFQWDRHIQKFGADNYHRHLTEKWSDLADVEPVVRNILKRVVDYTVELSGDDDIDICSVWFSKHNPGAWLQYHNDNDEGRNTHFKFSAVIYLNTISTGRLEFPFRRFSHKPNAGELVLFDSQHKSNGHKVDRIDDDRYSMPIWLASKEHSVWNYFGIEPN